MRRSWSCGHCAVSRNRSARRWRARWSGSFMRGAKMIRAPAIPRCSASRRRFCPAAELMLEILLSEDQIRVAAARARAGMARRPPFRPCHVNARCSRLCRGHQCACGLLRGKSGSSPQRVGNPCQVVAVTLSAVGTLTPLDVDPRPNRKSQLARLLLRRHPICHS